MKEFRASTGGRFTYNDDILNLQELSLAYSQIFDGCGNFIISGCKTNGDQISEGYVFLNGKVRYFHGKDNISRWPQYLYENNYEGSGPYNTGVNKVSYMMYGCLMDDMIPSSISENPIEFIEFNRNGLTMNDAFFGKYALLLRSKSGIQVVRSKVRFEDYVSVDAPLSSNTAVGVWSGSNYGSMSYDGDNLIIKSVLGVEGSDVYSIMFDQEYGVSVFKNRSELARISDGDIAFYRPTRFNDAVIGGIAIDSDNGIYQKASSSNSGTLNLNMMGYQGGTSRFRTLNIGNGKARIMMSVNGQDNKVSFMAPVSIQSNTIDNKFVLKANKAKEDMTMRDSISFVDSQDYTIASVGFTSTTNNIFYLTSHIGNVEITGLESVNIGPVIKENGTPLASKYVQQSNYTRDMALKADLTEVQRLIATLYSKAELDVKFSNYAKLDKFLSDMINSNADNRNAILQNLGLIPYDSDWIQIEETNLYIKQVGNVVTVQGGHSPQHLNGNPSLGFESLILPEGITPPAHLVSCAGSRGNLGMSIVKVEESTEIHFVRQYAGYENEDRPHTDSDNFCLTYIV